MARVIKVPVERKQANVNSIEIVDADGAVLCELMADQDTDDLTALDWAKAQEMVAALNAYVGES